MGTVLPKDAKKCPILGFSVQKFGQQSKQFIPIECFAFPYHQYIPAECSQLGDVSSIPFHVLLEFPAPVQGPGFGPCRPAATFVPMPKTAMHEKNLSQPRKDQIGRTRQIAAMETETVTQGMRCPTNGTLRSGIPATNPAHQGRSRCIDGLAVEVVVRDDHGNDLFKRYRPCLWVGRGIECFGKVGFMKSTTFTVDAALLRELGERLIGRSYIALAELVKNSYDADAADCEIMFREDRIVVSDNGHGMSEQEFHGHWMRIGTTHKTEKKKSRLLHRPMTGSKGLGRLSVQFLADEMTLESTSTDDPSRHLYAFVDWTDIRHGKDLGTVNVLWEMRNERLSYPDSHDTGTKITLKNLRFDWSEEEIENLGRDVWMLQSPFKRSNRRSHDRSAEDFYVDIDAPGIENAKDVFDKLKEALFENWKARIRGSLDDGRSNGKATVVVEFKSGYPGGNEKKRSFRETITLPIDNPKNTKSNRSDSPAIDRTRFEIFIFKTEGRQAGKISVQDMRDYLRTFGNVSVYDSGFRLPYYGSSQDWLEIAVDQGRRLVTSDLLPPRLKIDSRYLLDLPAPGRIFGTVEIDTNHERSVAERTDAEPGRWLQIQPGRDRLAANFAFEQLRDFVRFSLDFYANRFRLLMVQSKDQENAKESPTRSFNKAIKVLDLRKDEIPKPAYQEIRSEIVAARKAAEVQEQSIDQRAVLLAPLATAGITALAMNHELAREIRFLELTSDKLRSVARKYKIPALEEIADTIEQAHRRFHSLQELFAPLLSNEDREATGRLLVRPLVSHVVRAIEPLMPGVEFVLGGISGDLRFPIGSFSEWNAILQNILSNSWNAMLDSDRSVIFFDCGRRRRSEEYLRVSDTGVGLGVPLNESEKLFDPFERHLHISDDNRSIAMGGQGLGLAIVRMIANRRSTRVVFAHPERGFATTVEMSWRGSPK